jgi:hypothetical protein
MFSSTIKVHENIEFNTLDNNIFEHLIKNINSKQLATIVLDQNYAKDVININSSNYNEYKNKLFNDNHSLSINLDDTMFPFYTLFYYSSNWNGTITINYNNIINTYSIPTNQFTDSAYLIYITKGIINIIKISLYDLKKYLFEYENGKIGYSIDISNLTNVKTIFINKDSDNNLCYNTDTDPTNKTPLKLNYRV